MFLSFGSKIIPFLTWPILTQERLIITNSSHLLRAHYVSCALHTWPQGILLIPVLQWRKQRFRVVPWLAMSWGFKWHGHLVPESQNIGLADSRVHALGCHVALSTKKSRVPRREGYFLFFCPQVARSDWEMRGSLLHLCALSDCASKSFLGMLFLLWIPLYTTEGAPPCWGIFP